ncbi:MAG: ribbon-helix-helix protein, CopG family [Nanoarchaeota archaeon]|nr:ribbon-helix-helix protein, CopG family [Nanoarchaeota archaeon]
MARKGYTTIAIPDELADELDVIVENKKRGYSSRGELVKDAIRQLLDKIKKK